MTPASLPPDPGFNPRTPLVRAAHISLDLEASGRVQALRPDGGHRMISRGLEILTQFGTPTSAEDVLASLDLQGAHDWIAAYEAIQRLHADGLLHEPGRPRDTLVVRGFEGTSVHALMLNDRARTLGFIRAIQAVVRPGDVVVDIGTGSGILAMAAARAGARRVFAIEPSSMADTAAAVFEANGFEDRITVLRGTSFSVTLPEVADVIVTEMLGHHALDEGVLGLMADARARHARAGARAVPRRLTVLAMAVEIPANDLARHIASPRALASWKEAYGFDLSPIAHRPGISSFMEGPEDIAEWPALTPVVPVLEVDFEAARIPEIITTAASTLAERSGDVNGLVLGMLVDLADGIEIETLPGRAAPDNHWKCPVWLPREPFRVETGQPLYLRFSHGDPKHGRGEYAEVSPAEFPPESPRPSTAPELVTEPPAPLLSASTVVGRSPDHLAAKFGDEVALAPSTRVTPFILDSTGALIWSCLHRPVRIDAVCEALAAEFDIGPAECEPDVIEFLRDLIGKGLVRVVS
jgi:hypothetical protein